MFLKIMTTMKFSKYCLIAVLSLAAAASASCNREEDEIFDKTAAERLNEAQETYYNLLCSATNGWEMYYFCSSSERGYNFLIRFAEGDSAIIAARNANTSNAYAEEVSAFDVITDDGPVLTFNTYNTLFHRYADPDPDQTQDTDGVGSGGDYEFQIMSASDDVIYMRGKKTSIDIYMYPLEEGADWEQYFTDLYAMRDSMFNSSIPTLWLELADGVRYSISSASSQVMSMVPEGGDAVSETSTLSYVLTRTGFRWMENFPDDSESTAPAREFVWNDEGTYLVSTDFGGYTDDAVAGATIKAPSLVEMLSTAGLDWRSYESDLSGNLVSAYQDLSDAFLSYRSTYNLQYLHYYYSSSLECPCLGAYVISGRNRFEFVFYGEMESDGDNSVTLTFTGEGDTNAATILAAVPSIADFLNIISGTYTLSSSSEINPETILLTNDSNSFYVALQ